MYTITCRQRFCSSREETPSRNQRKKIGVKTSDPKPSTSQDKSTSGQPPQEEPVPEQQPPDEPIPEQQPDESVSEQQPPDESISEQHSQDESASEQQQDTPATKDKASDTLTSISSDESLPDYMPVLKTFTKKDPSSVPKKLRYSLQPKTDYI